MTDYLLVHGAGQGAWTWGAVWGHLTSPVEHPPRLYMPGRAGRVYPLDLPATALTPTAIPRRYAWRSVYTPLPGQLSERA